MRKRFSGIESGATFWYRIGQATSLPKLLLQRTPFSCNPPSLELQLDQKKLLFGLLESAPYLTTPSTTPSDRSGYGDLDLLILMIGQFGSFRDEHHLVKTVSIGGYFCDKSLLEKK